MSNPVSLPLDGVRAVVSGSDGIAEALSLLLGDYGCDVVDERGSGPGAVRLTGAGCDPKGGEARLTDPSDPIPGLPAGVPARAAAGMLATAAIAGSWAGDRIDVNSLAVPIFLLLPLVMARSYGANAPPRRVPQPVRGGWVATELGSPGDAELFELLTQTRSFADPEDLARAAQEWRLPVVPYRDARGCGHCAPAQPTSRERRMPRLAVPSGPPQSPLSGVSVLDLTVMWSGPLATWLLSALGAEVLTIEPAARPDGMRAVDGGGIYPSGVHIPARGDRSAMFNALAYGKRRYDLDLRQDRDRERFADLSSTAHVCLDNLSRRARADLAVSQLAAAVPVHVTLPAFDDVSERDWVAYGSQVHAASGLALPPGAPSPVPAAVAYPDALGGIIGACATVALLHAARIGRRFEAPWESSLTTACSRIDSDRDGGRLMRADPEEFVDRVMSKAGNLLQPRAVDGELRVHPSSPFIPRSRVVTGMSRNVRSTSR